MFKKQLAKSILFTNFVYVFYFLNVRFMGLYSVKMSSLFFFFENSLIKDQIQSWNKICHSIYPKIQKVKVRQHHKGISDWHSHYDGKVEQS